MKITLPPPRYEELVHRVESIPGVRSAAVTLTLPTTGWAGTPVHAAAQPPLRLNERPIAILQAVTPGYFRTLSIPLRRGRDFEKRDTAAAPPVALINESLARRFWPAYPSGLDPVGQYILAGASPVAVQVIGIVGDVRQSGLAEAAELGLYRPRTQTPALPAMFAVRTEGDPLRLVTAIRREMLAIDRYQPITAVKTMADIVDASEGRRQSIMMLLASFAATGLLLAVIGIYGVVAYSVAQRRREMGIRRALGASRGNVLRMVVRQGLGLALAGAAIGIAGAFALSRVLESLLYQVSATDPLTFAGVVLFLIFVALAASYYPAHRAAQIEPMAALRTD